MSAAEPEPDPDTSSTAATTSSAAETTQKPPKRSWVGEVNELISRVKLDENGNVPTKPFLDVAERFPRIFDIVFGEGRVSNHLKSDVGGNVDSLHTIYKANPAVFETLDQTPELSAGIEGRVKLLWLQRGLMWIFKLVQDLLSKPNDEVTTIAWESYEKSLGKHHNWFVRKFVGVAFSVAPDRVDLLNAFGLSESRFQKEGKIFVESFAPIIMIVNRWLVQQKLETE